jgi:hypothetical protein
MTSRSRWLARGVVATSVLLQAVVAPCARAAEPTRPLHEAITVEPGATCLDAATLMEHIQSWIGADTVDADVTVDVRGSPDQPRVVTFDTIRSGRVTAVRTFAPGPSRCEQLHAVLGLAIAMALKASLIEEVAPSAVSTPVPGVRPMPAEAPLPSAATAQPALALGVLPDAAFGVDLRFDRILLGALRARLGLLALLAPSETFNGAPGRFTTWLVAPRLDVCAAFEVALGLQARGCMGMSVGGLHAQGYSYPSSRSESVPWLAVANELGVSMGLSRRWAIDVDATLLVPVARNSIVVRDYSGIVLLERDLPPAGWIFAAGPLFRF